jgi:hypothetical protein
MPNKRQKMEWKRIFKEVCDCYEDAQTANLNINISVESMYRNMRDQLGRSTPGPDVKPCLSDFIADVELAARSVLTDTEYLMFIDVYLNQNDVPNTGSPETEEILETIQNKCAVEFTRRRIHPLQIYFREKYVRV